MSLLLEYEVETKRATSSEETIVETRNFGGDLAAAQHYVVKEPIPIPLEDQGAKRVKYSRTIRRIGGPS